MDARLLCAVGSFPPVSSSEDLMLGFMIKDLLKIQNILPYRSQGIYKPINATVWIDQTKEVVWGTQGVHYHADWEKLVDSDRPNVQEDSILNIQDFKRHLLSAFNNSINRHSQVIIGASAEVIVELTNTLARQFLELHNYLFKINSPESLANIDMEKLSTKLLNNIQPGTEKHKIQMKRLILQEYNHIS